MHHLQGEPPAIYPIQDVASSTVHSHSSQPYESVALAQGSLGQNPEAFE